MLHTCNDGWNRPLHSQDSEVNGEGCTMRFSTMIGHVVLTWYILTSTSAWENGMLSR